MATPQYTMGDDMAIVLNYGESNQSVVAGLNQLTLPTYMTSVIEISEFRSPKLRFAGETEIGEISYAGNFVIDDTDGQNVLKALWSSKEKKTNTRFYLDYENFMTCDLANDTNSGFQVVECAPGQGTKSQAIPYSGKQLCNGLIAYFYKHNIDGEAPAMGFTADTITGVPVAMGVAAGDTIIVEGSTSNDGQYLVESVATTTVTLSGTPALTVENAIEGTAVHAGTM